MKFSANRNQCIRDGLKVNTSKLRHKIEEKVAYADCRLLLNLRGIEKNLMRLQKCITALTERCYNLLIHLY